MREQEPQLRFQFFCFCCVLGQDKRSFSSHWPWKNPKSNNSKTNEPQTGRQVEKSFEVAGGRASSAVGRVFLLLGLLCHNLQSAPHWARTIWQTPGSGFLDELARLLLPSHSLQERQNRASGEWLSGSRTTYGPSWETKSTISELTKKLEEGESLHLLLPAHSYSCQQVPSLDSPPSRHHLWFPTGLATSLDAPGLYPKANTSLRESWSGFVGIWNTRQGQEDYWFK